MESFLNRINYSSVNEDCNSEITALRLTEADRCLCITGSGARALDLLTQPVGEIVSIDVNPSQNFLLELKMAAVKRLSYDEFCSFIGLTPSKLRLQTFSLIRTDLTSDARQFWDRTSGMIERGILYRGSWERYFNVLALYLSVTRRSLVLRLFASESLDEQARLWEEEWNNLHWRTFLRSISSRWCWKYILRDPGFYRYVPKDFSIGRYLYDSFQSASSNVLLKESPFASILFLGRLHPDAALPPHLQEAHFPVLQSNLRRISMLTASLSMLPDEQRIGRFDAFSTSDVSSYTDDAAYEQLWKNINAISTVGARVCERQFLVKRNIPELYAGKFLRNTQREYLLRENDNSIFYTFLCAVKT